jgi:hypothetical protein
MPVRKFRSVAEMNEPRWLPIGPELWQAMRALGELGARTVGHRFPPGVYKHANLEAAGALRQRWEDENVRRYQTRLAEVDVMKSRVPRRP